MRSNELVKSLEEGGCAVEVYEGSFDSLQVGFSAGEVKSAVSRESSGLGVRAQRDGRLGFVSSRDTSSEGMNRLAVHVGNALEVGDPARIAFPEQAPPPVDPATLECYDEQTVAITIEDLVEIGQGALASLRERWPKVSFDARVRRSVGKTRLRNSTGLSIEDRYSVFSFSVEATRTQDEDVLLDYAYVVGVTPAQARPEQVVEKLNQRLGWASETTVLKPGKMPVLFTPQGSLLIGGPLMQALNGKTVMLGTSPLRDRVGEQILDPRIQLTDDGLLPGGLGSAPFDDEGIPHQTRPLIEDGVLRGFVHDLETAAATNMDPTGNGERGGSTSRPGPGFSNVLLRGGDTSLADMLAGIEYGLLIHSAIGMGQGNTLPGTFSNPIDLGYLIEGGEVKGRVKDVSVAGNVYELLKDQLGGLSSEVERVGGSYFLPWMLIDDMNVIGKSS